MNDLDDPAPPDPAPHLPAPRRGLLGLAQRILGRLGIGSGTAADGAYAMGVEIVNFVGTFLSFSILGRKLGPDHYGAFAAMYSLIGIAISLSYVGPGLALLQHAMAGSLSAVTKHFFGIYLALTGFALALVLVLSTWVVPGASTSTLACFAVAELIGAGLIQAASTLRLAAIGFRATVPLQLLPILAKIACIGGLALAGRLTLLSYGVTYLILMVTAGVVVFRIVSRQLGIALQIAKVEGAHLRTTVTITSTIWAFNLHNDGDKLAMSANDLGADVGLYTAAYRLVSFATVPINALVNSTYRSFVDPAVGRFVQRAAKYTAYTVLYSAVAATVVGFSADWLLPLLVGDGFNGAITIVHWLAPLIVLRAFTHFPMSALMGLGKPKARLIAIVISATVAMVVYVILIPGHSWKGAVIGSYLSDLTLAVVLWAMLLHYDRAARREAAATAAAPT